jgi:hypothetical protein
MIRVARPFGLIGTYQRFGEALKKAIVSFPEMLVPILRVYKASQPRTLTK